MKSGRSIIKTKPSSTFINDLPVKQELPKVCLPTHDTDKFWLSIDPYCCDVSKEDVNVGIRFQSNVKLFTVKFILFIAPGFK